MAKSMCVGLVYLLATGVLATAAEELRNIPAPDNVSSIRASWFDTGYNTFVRGWSVPNEQWKPLLESLKKSRERAKGANGAEAGHLYLDIRIATKDGRHLSILVGKGGILKGYPTKRCKDPFVFSEHGGAFVRNRLGELFREAEQ